MKGGAQRIIGDARQRGLRLLMDEPILAIKRRRQQSEKSDPSLVYEDRRPIIEIICGTAVNELHFTSHRLVSFLKLCLN